MQILFPDFDPFVYFCRVISISKVGYVTMIGDFCIKSASGLMPDSIFARRRESSILARCLGILGHHGVKQRCFWRHISGRSEVISLFAIFPLCLYKAGCLEFGNCHWGGRLKCVLVINSVEKTIVLGFV